MTPEDKVEELFPAKMLEVKIKALINQQLTHLPMILPMIQWQVGATPLAIHSYNVGSVALLIGNSLGMEGDELYQLVVAAILHDVGKAFIGNQILDKNGKLAPAEFFTMQQHPKIGAVFLNTHYPKMDEKIIDAVLKHHEKADGSGYYHYKDEEVPEYARIIAAADIFSAATEERTYHPARSFREGYGILSQIPGMDTKYLDPIKEYILKDPLPEPNIIY